MKPTLQLVQPPVVDLARIRTIPTIEVMETDLDTLDALMAHENTAFGFFTATAGTCVSASLTWLTVTGLSPVQRAALPAIVIVLALATAWFFAQWRLARARRPALLRELRSRAARPTP